MNAHDDWYLISAYLDGELSPGEHTQARRHLDSCDSCRRQEQSLRAVKARIASIPRHEAPLSLLAGLDRLIRPAPTARVLEFLHRRRVLAPAGALAATALLVTVWIGYNRVGEELPLEPLMAAHSRYSAESLVPHGDLVASNFSAQLATYEAQE